MTPLYLLAYVAKGHFDWDAALTLGTCAIVICRMAWRPINWVFNRYGQELTGFNMSRKAKLWNILLGAVVTLITVCGMLAATVLLGYWLGQFLFHMHLYEGVIWDHTRAVWVPYHG